MKKVLQSHSATHNPDLRSDWLGRPAVAPPEVHEVLADAGKPLDEGTRRSMESRFGQDFSAVRVHTDARAADSARAVQARAYTVGRHIAFAEDAYRPGDSEGRTLLAHELTHVAQQGEVTPGAPLQIGETDTPHEQQAAANAAQVAAQGTTPIGTTPMGTTPMAVDPLTAPAVQRDPPSRREQMEDERRQREREQSRLGPSTPSLPPPLFSGGLSLSFDAGFRPRGLSIYATGPKLPIVGRTSGGLVLDENWRPDFGVGGAGGITGLRDLRSKLRGGLGGGRTPASPLPTGPFWPTPTGPVFRPPPGITLPGQTPGATQGPDQWTPPQLELPQLGSSLPSLRSTIGSISSSTFDGFEINGSTIPSSFESELDHLASLLNIYRDAEVHIEGHTDSTGFERNNTTLSQRRADAVRQALIDRNVVNPERLITEPYGESNLLFPEEASDQERARNRRVEVWYVTRTESPQLRLGDQP